MLSIFLLLPLSVLIRLHAHAAGSHHAAAPLQPNPAHQHLQSATVTQRSLAAPLNGSAQTGCKLKFAPASGCDQLGDQVEQEQQETVVARGAAAGKGNSGFLFLTGI
jgi:hypothetical protein